uniref:LITAF domain-containing protein n=1 Tax=Heterorhabditis bacteriophora TaxID=37862 RepID=A0A1I7WSQ4_HETBA
MLLWLVIYEQSPLVARLHRPQGFLATNQHIHPISYQLNRIVAHLTKLLVVNPSLLISLFMMLCYSMMHNMSSPPPSYFPPRPPPPYKEQNNENEQKESSSSYKISPPPFAPLSGPAPTQMNPATLHSVQHQSQMQNPPLNRPLQTTHIVVIHNVKEAPTFSPYITYCEKCGVSY